VQPCGRTLRRVTPDDCFCAQTSSRAGVRWYLRRVPETCSRAGVRCYLRRVTETWSRAGVRWYPRRQQRAAVRAYVEESYRYVQPCGSTSVFRAGLQKRAAVRAYVAIRGWLANSQNLTSTAPNLRFSRKHRQTARAGRKTHLYA
jgi:hypothetical protein